MVVSVRLAALICAALLAVFSIEARAAIYAVVVGVDAYRSLPKLTGAANDARDLSAALSRLGADVDLLVDGAATRERTLAAIRRNVARAGPGDMVVFTYAGHGIQEDEAIPGDEADGKDESIVFAAFDRFSNNAGERIRDNEIGALFRDLDPKARALIVIDSCHSGTMTRNADARGAAVTTRFGGIGRLGVDPLPPPPPATKGLELSGGANVIYVAASRDDEQIPEVRIGGSMRGAVSWSVARVLEGSAAARPDMPLADFGKYVRAQARALSASRQTPSVSAPSDIGPGDPLMPSSALAAGYSAAGAHEPAPERQPLVFAIGQPPEGNIAGQGRFTMDRDLADLVWDVDHGEVIDAAGADLIGEAWDAAMLGDVLAMWRASRALRQWPDRRPAAVRLSPGDGRHRLGEQVEVFVERPNDAPAYLTIVNLASDGRTQFLFPSPEVREGGADLIAAGEGEVSIGSFQVSDPIGADHVLAILSPERPAALHAWLEVGRPDALALVADLRAKAGGANYAVGFTPIFTAR